MRHEPIIVVLNDWGTVCDALEEHDARTLDVTSKRELKRALKHADALVLTGGSDITPSRYGAEAHPKSSGFDKSRDALEFAAVRIARKRRIPMMGICRGHQLLNAAYGGTLIQHLPDLSHTHSHGGGSHAVVLNGEASVVNTMGTERLYSVTTLHHQAVDRLGDGLIPVGWAYDGTVEMLESAPGTKPYVLGTQFHPEYDWKQDEASKRIFQHFVDLVRQRSVSRGNYSKRIKALEDLMYLSTSLTISHSYSSTAPHGYRYGRQSRVPEAWSGGYAWDEDWAVMDYNEWRVLSQQMEDEEGRIKAATKEVTETCAFPPCASQVTCGVYGECNAEKLASEVAQRYAGKTGGDGCE